MSCKMLVEYHILYCHEQWITCLKLKRCHTILNVHQFVFFNMGTKCKVCFTVCIYTHTLSLAFHKARSSFSQSCRMGNSWIDYGSTILLVDYFLSYFTLHTIGKYFLSYLKLTLTQSLINPTEKNKNGLQSQHNRKWSHICITI